VNLTDFEHNFTRTCHNTDEKPNCTNFTINWGKFDSVESIKEWVGGMEGI